MDWKNLLDKFPVEKKEIEKAKRSLENTYNFKLLDYNSYATCIHNLEKSWFKSYEEKADYSTLLISRCNIVSFRDFNWEFFYYMVYGLQKCEMEDATYAANGKETIFIKNDWEASYKIPFYIENRDGVVYASEWCRGIREYLTTDGKHLIQCNKNENSLSTTITRFSAYNASRIYDECSKAVYGGGNDNIINAKIEDLLFYRFSFGYDVTTALFRLIINELWLVNSADYRNQLMEFNEELGKLLRIINTVNFPAIRNELSIIAGEDLLYCLDWKHSTKTELSDSIKKNYERVEAFFRKAVEAFNSQDYLDIQRLRWLSSVEAENIDKYYNINDECRKTVKRMEKETTFNLKSDFLNYLMKKNESVYTSIQGPMDAETGRKIYALQAIYSTIDSDERIGNDVKAVFYHWYKSIHFYCTNDTKDADLFLKDQIQDDHDKKNMIPSFYEDNDKAKKVIADSLISRIKTSELRDLDKVIDIISDDIDTVFNNLYFYKEWKEANNLWNSRQKQIKQGSTTDWFYIYAWLNRTVITSFLERF